MYKMYKCMCIFYFTFYAVNSFNNFNFLRITNKLNNENNYSPFGSKYYEQYLKKLNSRNNSIQNNAILGVHYKTSQPSQVPQKSENNTMNNNTANSEKKYFPFKQKFVIVKNHFDLQDIFGSDGSFNLDGLTNENEDNDEDEGKYDAGDEDSKDDVKKHYYNQYGKLIRTNRGSNKPKKSENFEVIVNSSVTFKDIGGYENIKSELMQCVDILNNYKKYASYNVRVPKGIILEGPPGNGKTLLAKGFAGESKTSFIPVSGSEFQEKYVGVGSSRVRELFDLALKNAPCIIFIDEIDAIGRKRSGDGESSTTERDSTLNELLIKLDGFKSSSGIFLMGATNRADLLDPALLRPGRIDKRIFIGPPDASTREAILNIHMKGKPSHSSIIVKDLVDLTAGLSCSQIENLLNEAMLNALRNNKDIMEYKDIDNVINKIMVGWQPTEHKFTTDILERICIHEMGHAIVGFLSKHHSKVSKVIINLSSPNTPGYTMFETSTTSIYTREALFEHLMILLAGRIAEEAFYDVSVTTGAINDFEEAFKLAEKMVVYYGMGKSIIYPNLSEKYKEIIDEEVFNLINEAYALSNFIVRNTIDLIRDCAHILKTEKILKIDRLTEIINVKFPQVLDLKIEM